VDQGLLSEIKLPRLIFLAILGIGCTGGHADEWVRNTFPGPGHVANEGPWGPGQGSDRTEWISFFQVHPSNPEFMLQGTDLGRLVYTNTALGGTGFIAAEVPVRHTATCAFDPHDEQTAYVLFYEHFLAGKAGWWKTVDEGETWYQVLDTPADRGLLNLLEVNPDPARQNLVYIGTRGDGLYRSIDGGETFSPWLLGGMTVLQVAIEPEGDALYAIVEASIDELYRIDLVSGIPNLVYTGDIRYIDPHPSFDNSGLAVIGTSLLPYTWTGASWNTGSSLLTKATMRTARYNPANPEHIVMVAEGGFTGFFQWSIDGGTSWNQWATSGGETTAFVDYGPHNHAAAPDYHYPEGFPPNSIRGQLLYDFIPGDPDAVVLWDMGWYKGPMRSDDYGANFRLFAHGGNFKNGSQISIGSTDKVIVVGGLEAGVTMSSDGGETWRSYHKFNVPSFPQNQGTKDYWRYRSTWGVGIDPSNDNVVIATVGWDPVRIMRTEDFGATWSEVGRIDISTIPAFSEASLEVEWDRTDPGRVYVHNIRNTNGGTSFTDGSGNLTAGNTLLAHAVTAISASNGNIVLSKEGGRDWFLSLDAGSTWTELPEPPNATDGATTIVTPNSHSGAQIDPNPLKDPTLSSFRRIRILNGGEGGIWQFSASNTSGSSGSWSLLSGSAPNAQPHAAINWLIGAAIDARVGEHATIYGVPGYCGSTTRGDLGYRQVYRSTDGGANWNDLYASGQQGELPDYVTVGPYVVSHNTGALYLFDPTGLYRYSDDSVQGFRTAVIGGTGDGLNVPGSSVSFAAIPASGKTFSHWEGDWQLLENPFDPSQTITTTADHIAFNAVFNDIGAVPDFASWFAVEYPSTPVAERGWLDDPDKDGKVNGIEYFTGTSPMDGGSLRNPVALVESIPAGWRVTFHRRLGVQGAVPLVETGPDLSIWDPALPASFSISESGGVEEIQLDIDSTDPAFFSRATISSE
jgi:photosystem II stability/assembly factor-like uncharacterized protein